MSVVQRWTALSTVWKAMFRDHEIFVRTGGEVRFLRVSAAVQRRVAMTVLAVLALWAVFTIVMMAINLYSSWHSRDVADRAVEVERAEAQLAAQRDRVASTVESLDARQDYFESVIASLGAQPADDAADALDSGAQSDAAAASAQGDEISILDTIDRRQTRLAASLTRLIEARSARAAAALASVGIRPGSTANQGGPFIPAGRRETRVPRDPEFQRLAVAFNRMEQLEGLVSSIPSTIPAEGMNLSSGFGYRRDPFTGAGAMHSGLDFKGAHGSPILSAAAGRVSAVGPQSGYGNTIEVDHGYGIITRYAHLSGYTARIGQTVAAGQQIGRMGSSGRSTGTHLHFEVRVNGNAVNPRRFLESNPDVLQVQAAVGQRIRSRVAAR